MSTTATPTQLLPNNGKESNFNTSEWKKVSIETSLGTLSAEAGQALAFDLKKIGSILQLTGSTITFNLVVTPTVAFDGSTVNYCAPTMFENVTFDTGDSIPVNITHPWAGYVVEKLRRPDDYSTSSAHQYERTSFSVANGSSATIPISMPLNILCKFFDIENYYHKAQSRLTLRLASHLNSCVSIASGSGTSIASVALENIKLNYVHFDVSDAMKSMMLESWSVSPNTFKFDSFKIDTRNINGQDAYLVSNDRTAVQHLAIICTAQSGGGGVTFDYSNPLPISMRPVQVNCDVNGMRQVERDIADSRAHMAIVSEAMNLDDELTGCNSLLIDGILHGNNYGGIFIWQTGMEVDPLNNVRTGLNTPQRNNYINVDLGVLAHNGGALGTGTVYNVIMSQELFNQTMIGSTWIK